jgi:uncharacterized phage protein (TIGR02218 family)
LGDSSCSFDLDTPGYFQESKADQIEGARVFRWKEMKQFEPGWFARGRLSVKSGAAVGLWGVVKRDWFEGDIRVVELWEPIRAKVQAGDLIRLNAGCDKRMDTCRFKFANLINFQGFPDIPSEDWVMAVPSRGGNNSGGSLR